ncbi:MAG: DUF6516 family protein [bacterium]
MLIEEYFKEINEAIEKSPFVIQSDIFKDKRSLYVGFVSGIICFQDGSRLNFTEFVDVSEKIDKYKYRYHYQARDGVRVFRYIMAPHHRHISTFPDHKHIGPETSPNKVMESEEPTLKEVIAEIESLIV